MTQKEIIIINAINRAGLDNSMWGIETCIHSHDTRHIYGTLEHIKVPRHIYVYRDNESEDDLVVKDITPSRTIEDEYGQLIDLYYLHNEEVLYKEDDIRKWADEHELNSDLVLAQLNGLSFMDYMKGGIQ